MSENKRDVSFLNDLKKKKMISDEEASKLQTSIL